MKDKEMIEEMAKLKTCPFCGGKAHIKIIDHDSHGKESYKVIISCGTWNCDVKREFYWFNTEKQAIQCSIDLWNNRVDEPKLPKDSVVLSREEYELYDIVKKGYPNDVSCLSEKFTEIDHKARKETAEKMLKEIYCKSVKHIKGKELSECFIELSFEQFDELAKRCGVEIKE